MEIDFILFVYINIFINKVVNVSLFLISKYIYIHIYIHNIINININISNKCRTHEINALLDIRSNFEKFGRWMIKSKVTSVEKLICRKIKYKNVIK